MSRIFNAPRKLIVLITSIHTKISTTTPSTTTIKLATIKVSLMIKAMLLLLSSSTRGLVVVL